MRKAARWNHSPYGASRLGITVLPQSALGNNQYENALLVSRPFVAPAPSRTVAIAWRASFPRPKAIEALIQAISHCQQPTQAVKSAP